MVAQADGPFRSQLEDIGNLRVRNASGAMVPLGALVRTRETVGPDRTLRDNSFPTADINGSVAPGVSSGQAVATMERLAGEILPQGMGFEWTELTYQQVLEGATLLLVFPLSVMLAFLVLAAQYESWSLPLVVILIVPLSVLAAMAGVWLTGGDNNIFIQVGLVVLAGLACKNAILIVEFARELELQGRGVLEAALEACRIRLRPILMTSLAFIMGVVPLVISTGAGAEIRRALGVAVFAGMLGVTIFGLFLTPVFYVVIRSLVSRRAASTAPEGQSYPKRDSERLPLLGTRPRARGRILVSVSTTTTFTTPTRKRVFPCCPCSRASTLVSSVLGLLLFVSPGASQTISVAAAGPAQLLTAVPGTEDTSIRPFRIHVSDAQLSDLRRRLLATRWPDKETVADPSQGAHARKLRSSSGTGARDYDWRKARRGSTPCRSS